MGERMGAMPVVAGAGRSRAMLIWAAITSVVGWFPVLSVLACAAIARIGHCQVNEGGPQPCHVFGADVGALAYGLGVMGWAFLVTFPLVLVSIVLWSLLLMRVLFRVAARIRTRT